VTQTERLSQLLREFERVGVDPNTISAGLAVRDDEVLRVLAGLPDGAGAGAFLTQLRLSMEGAGHSSPSVEPPPSD
jgi:hypothetical protein